MDKGQKILDKLLEQHEVHAIQVTLDDGSTKLMKPGTEYNRLIAYMSARKIPYTIKKLYGVKAGILYGNKTD